MHCRCRLELRRSAGIKRRTIQRWNAISERAGNDAPTAPNLTSSSERPIHLRAVAPRDLHSSPQSRRINGIEPNRSATLFSPRSFCGNENGGMRFHKLGLVIGREHNHPMMFIRVTEGGENFPVDPEIRMVHMGSFSRMRHAQGNAAKLGGSHRPRIYNERSGALQGAPVILSRADGEGPHNRSLVSN